MDYNISTNIIRDASKDLNYIVTPNATKIFERIFGSEKSSTKSFTIIGNYGTGKSSFLWALEKNLLKKKIYFSSVTNDKCKSYQFLKILGDSTSLTFAFQKSLGLDTDSSSRDIIDELEERRQAAEKKKNGFVILIDEFGKFLEYINKNKGSNDLYLLQLVSEWVNDAEKQTYFVITLHQNFISYSSSLEIIEKQEWEKIKGRFVELLFNEPVEQLLFFASKQLENIDIPKSKIIEFEKLNNEIIQSNLVNYSRSNASSLFNKLYPLDWLSANILVQSLQRYGQNERSLFTFLNDFSKSYDNSEDLSFFNVNAVYDYLIQTLSSDIQNYNNPHRPQWLSSMRALERAELNFSEDYYLASEIIKTVCLVNIFCKTGGKFDKEFAVNYLNLTTKFDIILLNKAIEKLEKSGIIRFYKHSNKLNFLEGTDIDIEQELTNVSKEIEVNFSIADELIKLISFPVENAKKHSYETGTPRYFEYKILNEINDIKRAEGSVDGYINLIFNSKIKIKDIELISENNKSDLYVVYKNSDEIYNEIFTVNKYKILLKKFSSDINACKLLNEELQHHTNRLNRLVLQNLYTNSNSNLWYRSGKKVNVKSKKDLNGILSDICDKEFYKAPKIKNELFNREFLSPQINLARRLLMRKVLEFMDKPNLGFEDSKFPPEKSIYLSLIKNTGIHNNSNEFYTYNIPTATSFKYLWDECNKFIIEASNSRRNLGELYDILKSKPFKLKSGFIEFWIPLFLIIKKEDYALFHEVSGFVPYLSDDILDLIHKAPRNYSIKSFNDKNINISLIEKYKKITNTEFEGRNSLLLAIFGNYLKFYRALNAYAVNTNNLSLNTIRLRDAIKNAKDPEDALLVQFPNALGFHMLTFNDDSSIVDNFFIEIDNSIDELKGCFNELIYRIEKIILQSFDCDKNDFIEYKTHIVESLKNVKPDLLSSNQNVFFRRITSLLEDRNSWIKSIADAVLGRSIESIQDEEEFQLIKNIKESIKGLKLASIIHDENNKKSQKLVLFDFIDETGNYKQKNILVNSKISKAYLKSKQEISNNIANLDDDLRKQILYELLASEFKK
ncbi:ATP-binding protein [Flavobacterium aciduliphilum]|uniref:AAA domain-containing protein n=1 Tax=Flavobacterium aciduliphilum TaxID=1101402 RepID=A0A328YKU8_9FLAO|nr:ATP-binding protein [Flavobacterium aciduliphilum]RAR73713.1 hypothetical protein CLV55_10332 [Flavobacterium aciduliphilum]